MKVYTTANIDHMQGARGSLGAMLANLAELQQLVIGYKERRKEDEPPIIQLNLARKRREKHSTTKIRKMHVLRVEICTTILLFLSFTSTLDARPATAGQPGGKSSSNFALLELALRQVLREIACQELTAAELERQFRSPNSTITRDVKAILKSIDLPAHGGCNGLAPCKHSASTSAEQSSGKLHFLDFRRSVNDRDCVASALPRLRLIESAVPVFPAYYMDWECGDGCRSNYTDVNNYELLQKTGTCCDGTADWATVEATHTYPLKVFRTCTVNRNA